MKGFHHSISLPAAALRAVLHVLCVGGLLIGGGVSTFAASKSEAKALASADATPPVALVRIDSRGAGLNVIPMAPEQIEAQVLDLTRQVAQRVGRGGGNGSIGGTGATVSRIEVSLGAVDTRLRLAPCDNVQAYVPSGTNLWGRSRVGLRCEQGPVRWNVYVPVTVRAFGHGVVPAINLTPGSRIEAADLRVAEVDLAADGSPAVLSPDEAVGRLVARSVQAGQSLRQQHLKAKRYFAVGDPVRLIVKGPGFSVNGEGEALTPGDEGQCARIRTEAGRVVCGRPVGERVAELLL
ncbi:flagellar basal body P-ring formation chaperone FlgA [Aquabacterium sp.]|uniref:flagellar basal body P-ring formation chaperone FlgA n=1 Tax=Aquabacterium sp. TaxID=1872578 RepID=UPI0035B194AC